MNSFNCPSCENDYDSEENHVCNNCLELKCDCFCARPIIEERTITFTKQVKIKIHEFGGEYWDSFYSINECIDVWDGGAPRMGAHHWDTECCHVAQDPANKKWVLLYM